MQEVTMAKFLLVFSAFFLFSSSSFCQVTQSESKTKDASPLYQKATLLKLTAQASTQTKEVSHTTFTNAVVVSEKIVTYHFTVRSGTKQYFAQYTPAKQPGNLPHAWWQGNAPVEIRVNNRTLFIKLPDGGEVASEIASQTSSTK
jgi:hypothetical protein